MPFWKDGNGRTHIDRLADEDNNITHFACCICFEWVAPDDAWRDDGGQRWDMCQSCGREEGR